MTDSERIWAHFAAGGTLTVAEAVQKVGVYALSQRCGDLRRRGKPVLDWWEKLPSGKRVKRYGLMLPLIEDIMRTPRKPYLKRQKLRSR